MRQYIALSSNSAVHELYREFRISQGNLYHYTCEAAATSISTTGVLWLTRADCFFDEGEVNYGADILRSVIEREIVGDKQKLFCLLDGLWASLRQCYVFSVSSNPSSAHLLNEYGKTILELRDNFPFCLSHLAWHSIFDGNGFNLHHFIDLYESVEGYVIYEKNEQLRIARKVVSLLQQFSNGAEEFVDVFHARQLLITCITLFKHESYAQEEEYRVVLHRLNYGHAIDFDEVRESKGRVITYIKAQVAHFSHDCLITVRQVEGPNPQ